MINTWPGWESVCLLGEGSFGKVYKIKREEFGQTYEAALKVITIPASQSDVNAAYEEGMDEESVTKYFRSFVEDIVAEFALMSQLKGNSYIVSYEDHMVVQHEEGVGWDILIRMELLTALPDYGKKNPLQEKDVIRLGIHMTHALDLCRNRGIIHRDIKPENIFVSRDGNFKLGDFGVARVAEKTVTVMSRKGTYNYMAPEVYKSEKYGYAADICSLGLVLYRCLNDNRTPFLPPYPQPIAYSDREKALELRMSGEALPAPAHGSAKLQAIVQKACTYRPEDRYATPEEMRRELEALLLSSPTVTAPAAANSVADTQPVQGTASAEAGTAETKVPEVRSSEEKASETKMTEEKPVRIESEAEKKAAPKTEKKAKKPVVKREKKSATWTKKGGAGVVLFVGVFLLGTLLFCWNSLFSPLDYMDAYYMSGYGSFRHVVMTLAILAVPMTLISCQWPKLWNPDNEKRGKTVAAVAGLLVIAFVYGAMALYPALLTVIGVVVEYPLAAILGVVLMAGLWVGWRQMDQKQLFSQKWAGMAVNAAILAVVGIMMINRLAINGGYAVADMDLTWAEAYGHRSYETPAVVLGTFLNVLMLGLLTMLSGSLWNMEKKWGKWAWAALLVVEIFFLWLPIQWVLQLIMDLMSLPVITVVGLALGLAAIFGLSKLPGLLRKRKQNKVEKKKETKNETKE